MKLPTRPLPKFPCYTISAVINTWAYKFDRYFSARATWMPARALTTVLRQWYLKCQAYLQWGWWVAMMVGLGNAFQIRPLGYVGWGHHSFIKANWQILQPLLESNIITVPNSGTTCLPDRCTEISTIIIDINHSVWENAAWQLFEDIV